MTRLDNSDGAASTRRRSTTLIRATWAIAFVMTAVSPCWSQERGAAPRVREKVEKAEKPTRPPEVVNSEKPTKQPADPLEGPPFTTVKAWAIADGRTGEVLWGHHQEQQLEMASTTKIMTGFIVVRQMARDPKVGDELVTFTNRADNIIGSSSEIGEGERIPVRELLYGLLLPSGNDAAVAFGEHFGARLEPAAGASGSDDPLPRFVAEMNRVAAELGLKETHFANPNGLPDPGHHSSARDLARLAHRALGEPAFAAVVATKKHGSAVVDGRGKRREIAWTNTNHLLDVEGYDGVKTGTTRAAGTCLVASGRRGTDHLIVVVLGGSSSPDSRYPDARNLFRWAWKNRGHRDGDIGPASR